MQRMSRCQAALAAAFAALGCCITLAACGGGDGGGGGGGGGGDKASRPVTLKVGVIPIADVAPIYLGVKKGFFKQENLTIKPQLAEGGAAIVPSVVAGDNQIGFSNTTSLIIARSKKLPLRIISQGDIGGTNAKDAPDALLVKRDGPIRTADDLEGKTVAVNTLQNVGPLTINRSLEKRGVDYKKVKFNPFEETAKSLTVATYFTTERYIASNRDTVDRFVRAMRRSLEYADSHPEEVRDVVTEYTAIPAKVAQRMVLPQWGAELNESTIETTARLAERYGFVKQAPAVDDLVSAGK